MTTEHEKLSDLLEEVERYCEHENDEHGEYVRGLCHIAQYSYCMSNDFIAALVKQLEWESENYRKFCNIVKTKETYTREFVELEWH